jgi:hypothetical protein
MQIASFQILHYYFLYLAVFSYFTTHLILGYEIFL